MRYLVNDACVFLKKPLVDGSILLFDGQATVYLPGKGCYRCLYPTPPPPGMVPSCAEAGVLGALCGTIGSIQATEVLKLILGVGESPQRPPAAVRRPVDGDAHRCASAATPTAWSAATTRPITAADRLRRVLRHRARLDEE